jgi:hypothetical protein
MPHAEAPFHDTEHGETRKLQPSRYRHFMTAKALHIKTDGTFTELTLSGNYQEINALVGGWFDAVRGEDFVVYVHDEGLLIEGFEPNVFATMLTGRVIFGDVVIVGALNEDGEYDGENHDVPDEIVRLAHEECLRVNTSESYRQRVIDGRNEIMRDPVQVYSQNADGEWERV